jgi:hypothetical protein
MNNQAAAFRRSVSQQMRQNRLRTPDARFLALCELLETARAMAPKDPASVERRRKAQKRRDREREQFREFCRGLVTAGRDGISPGV